MYHIISMSNRRLGRILRLHVWFAVLNPAYRPPRTPWEKVARARACRATDILTADNGAIDTGEAQQEETTTEAKVN